MESFLKYNRDALAEHHAPVEASPAAARALRGLHGDR